MQAVAEVAQIAVATVASAEEEIVTYLELQIRAAVAADQTASQQPETVGRALSFCVIQILTLRLRPQVHPQLQPQVAT